MNMLAVNSSFLDHPTLVSVTGVLLSTYRLVGLRFGQQVLELIIASSRRGEPGGRVPPSTISGDACALCHLLLFPTIFDVEAVSIIPRSHSASPMRSPPEERPEKRPSTAVAAGEDVDIKNVIQSNVASRSQPRHPQQSSSPKQGSGKELLALQRFIRQIERARAMVALEMYVSQVCRHQLRLIPRPCHA